MRLIGTRAKKLGPTRRRSIEDRSQACTALSDSAGTQEDLWRDRYDESVSSGEAKEAQALGLVNEVVPKNAFYDRATVIAEQLAAKPQLFLRYTTLALRQRLLQRLNEATQLGWHSKASPQPTSPTNSRTSRRHNRVL